MVDKSMEEFRHYIYGIDYPAEKKKLLRQPRAAAPPTTSSRRSGTQTGNASTTLTRFFKRCEAPCRDPARRIWAGIFSGAAAPLYAVIRQVFS